MPGQSEQQGIGLATMGLKSFIGCLGDQVVSAQEETFDLFSQELPSSNLGFIDAKTSTLELTVADHDLTIHQSPTILASNRAGGTTGAVVWKITPAFAEWLSSQDSVLFESGVLSQSSTVLELGCGVSAIVGLLLAPRISHYILTDQSYVAKAVEKNIEANREAVFPARSVGGGPPVRGRRPRTASSAQRSTTTTATTGRGRIRFVPLDWETDEVTPQLTEGGPVPGADAVVACDCIYNEALIEPFVQTCVDICRLRAAASRPGRGGDEGEDGEGEDGNASVCIVAQQLRDPDVFEAWMTRFAESFDAWRVPDSVLSPGLRSDSGFVVHVGVLKGTLTSQGV
ncbi:hypothetical protein VTK73DRAFT_7116 [Phialemonium thermophilum]|uniref:Diaminohydroxyphosphoribosylamino-pyrimidine deaminase n=1 Tax=Phialemonium thermophilum TaxID=223376 RepID=A0ABR3WGK4_9PEZI